MSFVFYDTETTGSETSYDQILQFAAIRTDDALNEVDRFEIRCRVQPHILPAPGALIVTGATLVQLSDPRRLCRFGTFSRWRRGGKIATPTRTAASA